MTDLKGTPLDAKVTRANRDDRKQLFQMVDAVPAIAGKVGVRPSRAPITCWPIGATTLSRIASNCAIAASSR